MRPLSALIFSASLIALGAGCVDKGRYDALEVRYKTTDAALTVAQSEAADLRQREQVAVAQRVAAEKEALLLRAKLDHAEVEASLKPAPIAPVEAEKPAAPVAAVGATTKPASVPIATCEEQAAAAAAGGEWTINPATGGIVLDAGVLFLPGGGALRETAAKPVLDRLVAEINRPEAKDFLVRVEGHTDDIPINKSKNRDNWELAGKRALAVLNYLEEHGVAPDRLSFAGFGATRSLDARATPEARARNRRVEVVLVRRK